MIMTVSSFQMYLERQLGEPVRCEPSKLCPDMLRISKPSLKRFKVPQLNILRRWAPKGSVENNGCYHFLVDEHKLKEGIIELNQARKKR